MTLEHFIMMYIKLSYCTIQQNDSVLMMIIKYSVMCYFSNCSTKAITLKEKNCT